MLNHPITSSSHWRIPAHVSSSRLERSVWRAGLVGVAGAGRLAARRLWRTLVAGALVGSVLGPPLLVVVALISLFAPSITMGRHLAPALIVVALLWLSAAILGAHAKVRSSADEDDPFTTLP